MRTKRLTPTALRTVYTLIFLVLVYVLLRLARRGTPRSGTRPTLPSHSDPWLEKGLSSLPASLSSTTVPILLPVSSESPQTVQFLTRTLASLKKVDNIKQTPLLFMYNTLGKFGKEISAQLKGIDFATTVVTLPSPHELLLKGWTGKTPPPLKEEEEMARITYQLLRFSAHIPGTLGGVLLPVGLEVSEDCRDFSKWVLEQLDREGGLLGHVFAVNLYYRLGQGFGGSERYTLATKEHTLQPWGYVLPKRSWAMVEEVWRKAGVSWESALLTVLQASQVVLTPRISRSRPIKELADVNPGGEGMYIPDHPLDFNGKTLILVPRH